MESVAGIDGLDPVREKIDLYAAYTTLMDPSRRSDHDLGLERAHQLLGEPGAGAGSGGWARCPGCRAPVSGAWCGLCGTSVQPASQAPSRGLAADVLAELRALAARDQGELIEDPAGIFDFSFHYRRRSLFFKRTGQLSRPSAIRNLLRAAADVAAAQGLGVSPEFFALIEGDQLDRELFVRLLAEKPSRPGEKPARVGLVLASTTGPGITLLAPDPKGLASQSYGACRDWLAAALGVKIDLPPAPGG